MSTIGDPAYPWLANVTSLGVNIASLADNLYDGTRGRERCAPQLGLNVQFFVGFGVSTPNSTIYLATQPVVSGDGRMPFLEAGQRAYVHSPDGGVVVSHADANELLVGAIAGAVGGTPVAGPSAQFGATALTVTSFSAGGAANVSTYATEDGLHALSAMRMDLNPFQLEADLLFQTRRLPDGALVAA